MQKLLDISRKSFISLVICVQVFGAPAAVFAAESNNESSPAAAAASTDEAPAPAPEPAPAPAPAPEPTSPAPVSQATNTGPRTPTGADASTYKLNPATGLWENDKYSWDPVSKQTKPKVAPTYSYNPATGMWDTTEWYYQPETGKYVANTVSSAVRPISLGGGGGNFSINGTGPNSNNTINNNGSSTSTFDLFYNTTISNQLGSSATSGDALLQGNTLGGGATSGDAQSIVNILNLLQSSWGSQTDIATFIASLDGSIFGDLLLDPGALANGSGGNSTIDVNISNNARIDNDIDVAATSGDATVSGNTEAGDATSGNARALVNLFNLINSSIAADKSFIGILNINGDLDGDILLPPGLLEYLISTTGPNSNNQINGGTNNSLTANSETNRSIVNNVDATAGTGNAVVDGNTSAGNATSGTADTKVNTMNLVGQKVNAKNGLLVFVNVFGSWVGLLFNAPSGTSSIAATGPNSNNTINSTGSNNVSVDAIENSLINNDVNVSAQSGDATVSNNTSAGNAKTGNADVGVNILNMIDSSLNFSDFFGVLFINVFGSWNGSFGVDTAAGNRPVAASSSADNGPSGGNFQFLPTAPQAKKKTQAFGGIAAFTGGQSSGSGTTAAAAQSGSATVNGSSASSAKNDTAAVAVPRSSSSLQSWLLTAILIIGAGSLLFADRLIELIRRTTLLNRLAVLRRMLF